MSWLRRLEIQLARHPLVVNVVSDPNKIQIEFITGSKRTFIWFQTEYNQYYVNVGEEDLIKFEPIRIGYQYPWTALNRPDLRKYWFVPRKSIHRTTILEKEVLAQEILYKVQTEGIPQNYWTPEQIKEDLDHIKQSYACLDGTYITPYPKLTRTVKTVPGQKIIESYIPYFDKYALRNRNFQFHAFLRNRNRILSLILRMIFKTGLDLTTFNLRTAIYRNRVGPKMPNPIAYKSILRHFFGKDVSKREIYDVDPGLGQKAMACLALGCKYYYSGYFQPDLRDYLDMGITRFYYDQERFDVLMVDNHFKPQHITRQIPLINKSNDAIMFCTLKMANYMGNMYKINRLPISMPIGGIKYMVHIKVR